MGQQRHRRRLNIKRSQLDSCPLHCAGSLRCRAPVGLERSVRDELGTLARIQESELCSEPRHRHHVLRFAVDEFPSSEQSLRSEAC